MWRGIANFGFPSRGRDRRGGRCGEGVAAVSATGPGYLPVTTAFGGLGFTDPGEFHLYVFSNKLAGIGSSFAGGPPATVDLHVSVSPSILKGNDVVDVVTNLVFDLSAVRVVDGTTNAHFIATKYMECDEPRLNYDTNMWFLSGVGSPGSTNVRTRRLLGRGGLPLPNVQTCQARDGDAWMFVANRPLHVVGELGYLFYGEEWETLRLYHHGGQAALGLLHPVLDQFSVSGAGARRDKGLVNVNTRDVDVLKSVYRDLPVDYPHGAAGVRLDDASAADAAGVVISNIAVDVITNLSELGDYNWKLEYPDGSDMDKESFVRNAAGLLGYRQNLFEIVLYAQTTKTVPQLPDKSVVSEVRAVAEVWRDPVPLGGPNAYFVHTFKILSQ